MKKLLYILFSISLISVGQNITHDMFTSPPITDNNMSIIFNDVELNQFEGGLLGAFFDIGGEYVCVGFSEILSGGTGLAIFGDDTFLPGINGLECGESPIFAISYNNYIILLSSLLGENVSSNLPISENDINTCFDWLSGDILCDYFGLGYCANDLAIITNVYFEISSEGCTDELANNYNVEATEDDGSCSFENTSDCQNIYINLNNGWNMIGFSCSINTDAGIAFGPIQDKIIIAKDALGNAYLPSWEFNGIGDLERGYGYLLKVSEEINNYSICE